jgi:hypothetical protein
MADISNALGDPPEGSGRFRTSRSLAFKISPVWNGFLMRNPSYSGIAVSFPFR